MGQEFQVIGHCGPTKHFAAGIVEATRLVRGTSVNQPAKDVNHALVTSGVGIPTGGAILGKMD